MSTIGTSLKVAERVPPAFAGPLLLWQATFDIPMGTVEAFTLALFLLVATAAALTLGRSRVETDRITEDAIIELRKAAQERDRKLQALQDVLDEERVRMHRAELVATLAERRGGRHLRIASDGNARTNPSVV